MRPQHVELIVIVAETGSIGAAALRLNKTQPAISKALKTVETELGTPIFFRTSHGVIPTPGGEIVITRCRKIYVDLNRLDDEIKQIQGDMTGIIDVIVSPLAALKIMPPVMSKFHRKFPNITVNVTGGNEPSAFSPLRRGETDFIIGPSPDKFSSSGLNVEKLFSSPISILTGANSTFKNANDIRDLIDGKWIMIGPKTRRPTYYNAFEAINLKPAPPFVHSDSILTILSMIEGSDLLCSFPSLALPEILDKWDIIAIPLDAHLPNISIALTSSKDRFATPAETAFADLVKHQCASFEVPIT